MAEPWAPHVGGSVLRGFEPPPGGPVVAALQRAVDGGTGAPAARIRPAVPVATGDTQTSVTPFATADERPGTSSPAAFNASIEVQRSSADAHHSTLSVPSPEYPPNGPDSGGPRWAPTVFESPIGRPEIPTAQRMPQSGAPASSALTAAPHGLPLSAATSALQRAALPEAGMAAPAVQRDSDTEFNSMPAPFGTATTVSPRAADSPSSPGRIVLLPPVRTELSEPAGHPREVLADSSRPMSLQRMFGDFARPATEPDLTPLRATNEPAAVQAVTFDGPTVQREVTSEPDSIPFAQAVSEQAAPEQAPAGAAPAAPHGPAQAPADVDELVGRLYEPLAARLRTELWLDRERAGALMGLHR
ncbi:hypothetical protein [Mycobacterium sp. HM-7]